MLSQYAETVQISSVAGLLDLTMVAHRSSQVLEVADPAHPGGPGIPTLVDGLMTYAWTIGNGVSTTGANTGDGPSGPTLRVNPGDTLRIRLQNDLGDEPTNFHTHGLVISPAGDSDNVLISIPPGQSNTYEYQIPADTEPGVDWYHPHRHMYVTEQVYRGLAGFLIIGSANNDIDQVQSLPTRLMMVKTQSIARDPASGRTSLVPLTAVDSGNFQVTVNNQYLPDLQMQAPNELWIGLQLDVRDLVRTFQPASNDPADWYFDHPIQSLPYSEAPADSNIAAFYVAQDGAAFPQTVQKSRIALAPGKRVSEVISAPPEGEQRFVVATVVQPTAQDTLYTQPILSIHGVDAGGDPANWVDRPLTSATMQYEDLSALPVDVHRTVIFETRVVDGVTQFTVNGQVFPDAPVFQPRAGQVEEWTVINKDPYPHPIHIHLQDFQATRGLGPGYATPPHYYDQDVWYMDSNTTSVFRIKFKPTLGATVFHCHNLFHEDGGMMASLNVIPAQPLLVAADAERGGTARFYPLGAAASERVLDTPVATVQPFGPRYRGGMTAAMGDVNFDGVPDAVFGAGQGGRLVVLDGASQFRKVLFDFRPFGDRFRGRLQVAAGDLNGDGRADLLVAGGRGTAPVVRAYSGASGKLLTEFLAYEPGFRGGVNLTTGDVDGSGRIRVITAPAGAHSPEVKVWGWSLFTPNADPAPPRSVLGPPELVARFLAGQAGDRRGLTLTSTHFAANTGGFARLVTAPAVGAREATLWQLSAMGDHGMAGPGMDGAITASALTTIRAFPEHTVRAGLALASVNTPTGSLIALAARGSRGGLVRFFNAPRGVTPVAAGAIDARVSGAPALAGS